MNARYLTVMNSIIEKNNIIKIIWNNSVSSWLSLEHAAVKIVSSTNFSVMRIVLIVLIIIKFVYCDNETDDIIELIQNAGFNGKNYNVETEDGYILKVHRVLSPNITENDLKGVFFLQHGLFTTAADFVMSGRKKALAYYLAKNGYDVWMGNTRGSKHSVRHKTMSQDSDVFWDFSFHEMGYYDLPAMIDFVLSKTKKSKLIYVGHSQGAAAILVTLSLKPEYNDKIIQSHLITPAVYMKNFPHPFVSLLVKEIENGLFDDYSYLRMTPIWNTFSMTRGLLCDNSNSTNKRYQCGSLTFFMFFFLGPNRNGIELETVRKYIK